MIEKHKDGSLSAATETSPLAETPSPKGKSASHSVKHSAKPLPSQERLRELFDYDAETGELTWKARPRNDFKNPKYFNVWNARSANKVAGSLCEGYIYILIDSIKYRAHRLIWAFHFGVIPAGMQIDHINGIGFDNRLENLRLATNTENLQNIGKHCNSTTGVKGVHWHKRDNKYQANISFKYKNIYLGSFTTLEAAASAYREAAIELHGDFVHPSVLELPERQNVQLELLEVAK
jgi:hypothetical protein